MEYKFFKTLPDTSPTYYLIIGVREGSKKMKEFSSRKDFEDFVRQTDFLHSVYLLLVSNDKNDFIVDTFRKEVEQNCKILNSSKYAECRYIYEGLYKAEND